ncbi:OmpA family protein [Endothiovibrio diazotrophicus]
MNSRGLLLLGVSLLLSGCDTAQLSALVAPTKEPERLPAQEPLPTLDAHGWRVVDLSSRDHLASPVAAPSSRHEPSLSPGSSEGFRIPFASGSQHLGPQGRKAVAAAVKVLRSAPTIVLHGMTDDWGDTAFRDRLAFGRAVAVREALVAVGVPSSHIRILGRVTNTFARAVQITVGDDHAK